MHNVSTLLNYNKDHSEEVFPEQKHYGCKYSHNNIKGFHSKSTCLWEMLVTFGWKWADYANPVMIKNYCATTLVTFKEIFWSLNGKFE